MEEARIGNSAGTNVFSTSSPPVTSTAVRWVAASGAFTTATAASNKPSASVDIDVPLTLARERRDEVRKLLADGIDPSAKRKSERTTPADSFEAAVSSPAPAGEVVERTIQAHRKRKAGRREPISADAIDTMQRRLEAHVFPYIGARDVKRLTSHELLTVLRRIEEAERLNWRTAYVPSAVGC